MGLSPEGLLLCLLVVLMRVTWVGGVTRNVAQGKLDITAELTCGALSAQEDAPEVYYKHEQQYLPPGERTLYACDSTSTHPPSAMVDGSDDTWWQSTSRERFISMGYGTNGRPQAIITLDLGVDYTIDGIRIRMGNSRRPGYMSIMKSSDAVTYVPWVYFVRTELACFTRYTLPHRTTPTSLNDVVCQTYALATPAMTNEQIFLDFSGVATELGAWKRARAIRIEFYEIHLTLGINGDLFQHFTVRQLIVMAECECSGQNIVPGSNPPQTECDIDDVTGGYECTCYGNTQGTYCEQCLPLYNQQPYVYQQPCQQCQCYGHADSCVYDATLAATAGSIDIFGNYEGGGRCLSCRDNTAGVNCDECIAFYYRPLNVLASDPNPCIQCSCSGAGIGQNPNTGLMGDCVNNDRTIRAPEMSPGWCYCKANVQGPNCDECKPGFFNLQASNPLGCEACYCNAAGTRGGTLVCGTNNEQSGQCPCKDNVMNRNCDECMDMFYGLSTILPEGCLSCDCTRGASRSMICNKVTGQCSCRFNLQGFQCREALPSFYTTGPHSFHGEFEDLGGSWLRLIAGYEWFGYANVLPDSPAQTTIVIPAQTTLSDRWYIILRYVADFETNAELRIIGAGTLQEAAVILPQCTTWCYARIGWNNDVDITLLKGVTYTVRVTSVGQLAMDRAIALPWEYVNELTPALGDDAATFAATCDVTTDNMQVGEATEGFCMRGMYQLSTNYMDRALPCDCHQTGSYNNSCDSYEGQCPCKPGVVGRTCDQCQLDHFNMTEDGCQPCGCEGGYNVCDDTGQCLCPPNVIGRVCDECAANHWNFNSTTGCEPCNCNPTGSYVQQCDLATGACSCKPGVLEGMCNLCQPGYKGFTIAGCTPCNCNMAGSTSEVCDQNTGQCPCKGNTAGLLCNSCAAGSFYLRAEHDNGCLGCECSGVTDSCTSSSWRLTDGTIPLTTPEGGIALQLTTEEVTQSQNPPILTQVDGVQVLRAESVTGVPKLYFTYMDGGGPEGNQLGLYGTDLVFRIKYTSTRTDGIPIETEAAIVDTTGNIYRLKVDPVPINTLTTVTVKITNENLIADQGNVTRLEFLTALSRMRMLLVPASYLDRISSTDLYDIHYSVAELTGTGNVALNVEHCTCPNGYTGMSCQACIPGYKRAEVDTHPSLGTCVPCACNGHASMCDADTGECVDCQHNTAGPFCDICADGWFGDATVGTANDCSACPCLAPRVENSTCSMTADNEVRCTYCAEGYTGQRCDQCAPFYSGNPSIPNTGTCTMCFCNHNADTCDAGTGQCLACGNNTSGFNCGVCAPQYYGDASVGSCNECECVGEGSLGTICDATSGQCPCLSGVGGRQCSQCLPNYYGFDNPGITGCAECGCNMFGSTTEQCDPTGACICQDNVAGEKCDACVSGYWGLPTQACEPCNCNPTGTVTGETSCHSLTGQCTCKPGVAGRMCDVCDRMYQGFGSEGCSQCTGCQLTEGSDAYELVDQWWVYWNATVEVGAVQAQDFQLQALSETISSTTSDLGLSTDNLNSIDQLVNNMTQWSPVYTNNVNTLNERGATLVDESGALENSTRDELTRQNALLEEANNSTTIGTQLQSDMSAHIETLINYNESASGWRETGDTDVDFPDEDFNEQRRQATGELQNITMQNQEVGVIENRVEQQSNETGRLETEAAAANDALAVFESQIETITTDVSLIHDRTTNVYTDYNTTLTNKNTADQLMADSLTSLDAAEALLSDTAQNITLANNDRQHLHYLLNGYESQTIPLYSELVDTVPSSQHPIFRQGLQQVALTYLQQEIDRVDAALVVLETRINASMDNANGYTAQVQVLRNEYTSVEPIGEQAVAALDNYDRVVELLTQAEAQAAEARVAIAQAQAALNSITVAQINQQATDAEAQARTLNETVRQRAQTPIQLEARLTAANNSLQASIAYLTQLEADLQRFDGIMASLENLSQDSGVTPTLTSANTAAEMSLRKAAEITRDTALNAALQTQTTLVDNTVQTVQDSTQQLADINIALNSYQDTLTNSVQRNLDQASQLRLETAATRTRVETQFESIRAKIAEATAKLITLQQPVGFNYNSFVALPNPSGGSRTLLYNEIRLDFRYSSPQPQGLILFVQNTNSNEFLAIIIDEQKLKFLFNNGNEVIRITSLAELCQGCWFRVIASRYGNSGSLTTILIATRGYTKSSEEGLATDLNIQFNTDIFLGGLPVDYETDKVDRTTQFSGCIHNVYFDQTRLDIWQNMIESSMEEQCCQQPDRYVPEKRTGVSFGGFGPMVLEPNFFNITSEGQIKFEFRTLQTNAVLMLVMLPEIRDYLGLFLVNGLLQFEFGASPVITRITSTRTYSDGNWYHVTLYKDATRARLSVGYVDTSISPVIDPWETANPVGDTSRLTGAYVLFGAQYPAAQGGTGDSRVRGPVERAFAGCINNIQRNMDGDLNVVPVAVADLPVVSATTSSVWYDGCYANILSGLGMRSENAYAQLTLGLNEVTSVTFEVITYDSDGILMYGQNGAGRVPYFYLAMFNGEVYLMYNQGSGLSAPIRSDNAYLGDGQRHTVRVVFTIQPTLIVDDISYYATESATPGLAMPGARLYAGGVPSSIAVGMPGEFPVKNSMMGGIRMLTVNNQDTVDFGAATVIQRINQRNADLGGLPLPGEPGPDPTPEPVVQPTNETSVCADPYEATFSDVGVRFGSVQESYISYDMNALGQSQLFNSDFTLAVNFRAVESNGILVYAADTIEANPTYYFCLYMYDGKMGFSMTTDGGRSATRLFMSNFKYDDGGFYTVTILRMNDFLAIVMLGGNTDYRNNGQSSTVVTTLNIQTPLYIGGVPSTFVGLPFSSPEHIPCGNEPFHGCIKDVQVSTEATDFFQFNLSDPHTDVGIAECFQDVIPGVFLSGEVGSYLQVTSPFQRVNFNYGFTASIRFRTTQQDGTLLILYQHDNAYVVLDIFDGIIRLLLSDGNSRSQPFALTTTPSVIDPHVLCNNMDHTITFTVTEQRVSITVGAQTRIHMYPTLFRFVPLSNVPVYIGGQPTNQFWDFPNMFGTSRFGGCIEMLTIGDDTAALASSNNHNGMTVGCPGVASA